MNPFEVWATMAAAGVLTFATRLSFIALEGRYHPPAWFRAALPFVPIATLLALVAPDLLLVDGRIAPGGNPKLLAGLVAVGVAWRWKSASLTIVAGFAGLLLFSRLLA